MESTPCQSFRCHLKKDVLFQIVNGLLLFLALGYHHEQLTQEGFSYLGKTETQRIPKYLAKDIYIEKSIIGFLSLYHVI